MITDAQPMIESAVQVPGERPSLSDYGQNSLSMASFLRILLHRKKTVLYSAFTGLVLSTILAFLLAPTYTAVTSFVPPGSSNTTSAAALMGQLSALGGSSLLGGRSQGDLYMGILKSHTIARDLVQQFDLMSVYKVKKESQAEKILARNSLIEVGAKDPIVVISVTDRNPERARDIAQGYIQALQTTTASLALTESSQRRLFYEQRLAKEKDELANAEVSLKLVQEKSGLVAPAGQMAVQIQRLSELRAQLTDRQVRLSVLLHQETEENPDVIRLQNEVASIQAQINQSESSQSKQPFGRFSISQVPEMETEYIRKTRDVKYHEALFEIIAKQYEAARLDEAKDAPIQVLDHATVPDMKSGPHRSIIMVIGIMFGLLVGAVWVLFQAVSSNSLSL
jgi:tyrosine-protein kinase Etk/Wzc